MDEIKIEISDNELGDFSGSDVDEVVDTYHEETGTKSDILEM